MPTKKAVKRGPGQPLKFKSAKELEVKIDEYFAWCDNGFKTIEETNAKGETITKQIPHRTPYTMSGLAYALGCDRRTLLNYSNREQYFPTIKRARSRIEQSVEERLLSSTGVVAGQIFALKQNFGWDALTNEDNNKAHITIQILEGYGLKPGRVFIDAEQVEGLKKIASSA